jgi:AraC family transcriptional regulator
MHIGCSSNHTIRVFKKEFDKTPHAFIIEQKINKARQMMKRSKNTTLAVIAKEVGFYDQSHFSKSFKKVLGINPSTYRKLNKTYKAK